ncbi:carbohydrate ABC transporter permease [Microbispora sp. ATCC PTA-5024]|uniref:carbohydrate ABC transporter permease n=1 Tax=Microbispora sp. ATCC PTA-5024 TaxID=316330 RepID=UPI000424A946|nr:carbohydrate ABC transporter permease [Microbispora sp. ATCC PTA-5024]
MTPVPATAPVRGPRRRHAGTHLFLAAMALMWLAPLLWTLYAALRPKAVTDKYGYWSLHGPFGLGNFATAWTQGRMSAYFGNSLLITVPSVVLTLALASMTAFGVSRFRWRFNITLLVLFTAGNMLPPQVLAAPLFEMFKHTPLPYSVSSSGTLLDTYYAVIAVETAFQLGFCTFVLANYMKALPAALTEAALVDGASVWQQFSRVILPLSRPALAALATLQVVWLYNDYFWPLLFIHDGDRLPVTTGITNLQGQFLLDYNMIAAGATITVIPTLVVYLALQRHFVAGLTLGADKG